MFCIKPPLEKCLKECHKGKNWLASCFKNNGTLTSNRKNHEQIIGKTLVKNQLSVLSLIYIMMSAYGHLMILFGGWKTTSKQRVMMVLRWFGMNFKLTKRCSRRVSQDFVSCFSSRSKYLCLQEVTVFEHTNQKSRKEVTTTLLSMSRLLLRTTSFFILEVPNL